MLLIIEAWKNLKERFGFKDLLSYRLQKTAMKKIFLCLFVIVGAVFQFCSTTKKAIADVPKVTYTANIQPMINMHCSPCHIPPKGNKEALNTYETAKSHIDSMITRIKLNPADKGFMPFKHPKLPDSTINAFVQWKTDGLLEN